MFHKSSDCTLISQKQSELTTDIPDNVKITDNWQPLCKPHHDSTKQAEEKNGRPAIGVDGWPVTGESKE